MLALERSYQMENPPIDIEFDAVRVCEAISKIGYEPYSAIMDIIDNSVTAKSKNIYISLFLKEGKNLRSRNSVEKYRIVDDGQGMDAQGIINAFTLGSTQNYSSGSLSKYGMGLKSAGLSLGSKISIISKKDNSITDKYIFDLNLIKKNKKLQIIKETPSTEDIFFLSEHIKDSSGTYVEISGCEDVNQSSPNSTVAKLNQRLGVVYYSFLNNKNPLSIKIRTCLYNEKADYSEIKAKDLLFLDKAKEHTGWTKEGYDFLSPYLILQQPWDSLKDKDGNDLPPIIIQAVAFPQDKMANEKSILNSEDKLTVKSYEISRENSGFFIYRNGRLIRWGDELYSPTKGTRLIGKDDINIRIRFEITDAHDDVLHVDVSKQRLDIDDENLMDLERIISKALRTAKEIRAECGNSFKTVHTAGTTFSKSVLDIPEDDPLESSSGQPDPATLKRQDKKKEEARSTLIQLDEELGGTDDVPASLFKKIRYSEAIPHGQVWKPFYDSLNGVFVCVKKSHPFYEEFLSRYEEGSVQRLMIEALIFSAGLAESNVYDHETKVSEDNMNRIFRRFHSNIDRFLTEWTYDNHDVGNDD